MGKLRSTSRVNRYVTLLRSIMVPLWCDGPASRMTNGKGGVCSRGSRPRASMRKSRLECSMTTRGSGLLASMIAGSSPEWRVIVRGRGMLTSMIAGGGLKQSMVAGGSRLLASADLEGDTIAGGSG